MSLRGVPPKAGRRSNLYPPRPRHNLLLSHQPDPFVTCVALTPVFSPPVFSFLQYFLNRFEGIECIFMYGSMLKPLLSTQTSYPDFYVIVDNYRKFYKSSAHTLLNKILPPNSYFLKLNKNGTALQVLCYR